MPANVSVEYTYAEKKFLLAKTDEEKLLALEEMMRAMPQHKSAEKLRANIRTRYKKIKQEIEKKKQVKKQSKSKEGIKKEGIQVVLIGLTQSGKSSLLSVLTNAQPKIASHEFVTKEPLVGTLKYENIKFQIIDMPAINHETFDQGIANTADILLIVIASLQDIGKILPFLEKSIGKRIIAFNKSDILNESEKRKISASLQSKKFNFCIISCKTLEGISELKKKLLENSDVIRVYTKQPRKPADSEPVILPLSSTITELAEKIFHKKPNIKEARVTGPSSKFPNQKVSLSHILKDKDIVEFYTG